MNFSSRALVGLGRRGTSHVDVGYYDAGTTIQPAMLDCCDYDALRCLVAV